MINTAEDALEMKWRLYRWFSATDDAAYFCVEYAADLLHLRDKSPEESRGPLTYTARNLLDYFIQHLYRAPVYWATPPMMGLAEQVVSTMPDTTFHISDLPNKEGFLVVGWPQEILTDEYGRMYSNVQAVHWHCERADDREFVWVSLFVTNPGHPTVYNFLDNAPLVMNDMFVWEDGENLTDVTGTLARGLGLGDIDIDYRYIVQVIRCIWVLMGQRITVTRPEAPSRKAARRLSRYKGYEPSDVQVITLRRTTELHADDGPSEGSTRHYTCQWIVDGHWRKQWYPSLGCHKPIFISPYVKGPEGAPLRTRNRVYKWSR